MKVEDAIAMLQTIPAGSDVDLQIRRIVTPGGGPKPRRTSADRMRELRARRRGSSDAPPSQTVTEVTQSDGSDAGGRHGGTTGGSDPDQPQKSGKEGESTGSYLLGREAGAGANGHSDAKSDASHQASPSRVTRRQRKAPMFPFPDGFALNDRHRAHAEKKGWPWWWVENRFEQFADVAKAKAMVYADWDLAFYTFLRNEIGWRRGPAELAHQAPAGSAAAPAQLGLDDAGVAARAKAAEVERRQREKLEAERAARAARGSA